MEILFVGEDCGFKNENQKGLGLLFFFYDSGCKTTPTCTSIRIFSGIFLCLPLRVI
jgi:hypothetical protein